MAPHGTPTSEATRARRLYPAWDQGHGQGQNWWVHLRPSNQSIGLFFIWRKSDHFLCGIPNSIFENSRSGSRPKSAINPDKMKKKWKRSKKMKRPKSSLFGTLCSWPLTWPWRVNQLGAQNYYQHACEIWVQPVENFWSYCPHTI